MGMTRFMTDISPNGSGTYLFALLCRWDLNAISDNGARDPARLRGLGFVWLWRIRPVGALGIIPAFLNAVFPV